jgi:hypothetical protein
MGRDSFVSGDDPVAPVGRDGPPLLLPAHTRPVPRASGPSFLAHMIAMGDLPTLGELLRAVVGAVRPPEVAPAG